MKKSKHENAEDLRIAEKNNGTKKWLNWGPYLSERQWGTVREDYSPDGSAWNYFPHDHARGRTYRWGEDGIAGISDRYQRLCFAIGLWNGNDAIIKERLFGLSGPEGNHGEDCKELYYYLDSTPTHSYMKHLYKYPHAAYPYQQLLETNKQLGKESNEFEILDTLLFEQNNYFDVYTEYAKADVNDVLIKITVCNRSKNEHLLWILPTLWFRNLWSFGVEEKPNMSKISDNTIKATHQVIGDYYLQFDTPLQSLFTENETNNELIFNQPNGHPFKKDAFHEALIQDKLYDLLENVEGTKCSPLYKFNIAGEDSICIKLRLTKDLQNKDFTKDFNAIFETRKKEADEFYATIIAANANDDERNIQRQAYAGMLWSKQYYNIDVPLWLKGDDGQPTPPLSRQTGRNKAWQTLNNEDIISMPDKWEYPWYAAWDLAFHCVPIAKIDAEFAKKQLILFTREWYMHPNGQLPAYEWNFGDVNPPVHAWSALQVYKIDKNKTGKGDHEFLKRIFNKLLLNFTWWVNRKDEQGNNVFEGGFLGLDNIGVFDRSNEIPGGGHLEQADGTSWMAMYSLNMLEIALELAYVEPAYEDMCTKFFEHFVYIAESLNRIAANWTSSWDEEEGFFYDVLSLPNGNYIPLKVRSLVGLSTMFAALTLPKKQLDKVPEFYRRLQWFIDYRKKIDGYQVLEEDHSDESILLSLIPKYRLAKLLKAMLDENEFLSDGGIRSISKIHKEGYWVDIEGQKYGLQYDPGESSNGLFGGNSNWRGPVWIPMNYMLINAMNEYFEHFKDEMKVEFPTGSGNWVNLQKTAALLSERILSIFKKDENGSRRANALYPIYASNEHFKDLLQFYEYFHGDTLRGVGASHQTGWTGVIVDLFEKINQ